MTVNSTTKTGQKSGRSTKKAQFATEAALRENTVRRSTTPRIAPTGSRLSTETQSPTAGEAAPSSRVRRATDARLESFPSCTRYSVP